MARAIPANASNAFGVSGPGPDGTQSNSSAEGTGVMDGMDTFGRQALDILTSSRLKDALDLSKESPRTLERYGFDDPAFERDGPELRRVMELAGHSLDHLIPGHDPLVLQCFPSENDIARVDLAPLTPIAQTQ